MCHLDPKEITASFYFEEAIKAEPFNIKRIVAIAKRSHGYKSSKVLKELVKREEALLNK